MYIPTQFYGKIDACVSASGGDSTGEFVSGSQVWKYHKFTTIGSSSFTIHKGSTNNARVFIVAGGGGGGETESNGESGNESAGGGGGGGIVYTDYRLGPGSYTLYVGDGGLLKQQGEDSWIEMDYLPSDYTYYAPTGSRLTAEGGGVGGYFLNINNTSTGKVDATSGGSGGGGCASLRFVDGYTIAQRANGRTPQGNRGGIPNGNLCQGISELTATGGGGAGGQSDDTNCISAAGYQTAGGIGKFFNVDGTNTEYSCGGASMRVGSWEAAPRDTQPQASRMLGAGGWGASDSWGQGGTNKGEGRPGVIVILYPICNLDLSSCTEYSVDGGLNGGNITFLPCGQTNLETISLDPLDSISICSYPISPYPSASGDVTFTSTGSCSFYVEPPNPESCPTGSVLSPLFNTELDVTAPSVGPYPGYVSFTYTDYLGETQSTGQLGTGTHYVCAISGSVEVGINTNGSSWTITHTDTQCGNYCSGSF